MWITVEEYGKKYIVECLKRYISGNVFLIGLFIIYLISILFLLVKGSKKEKAVFVYPSIIWVLTVFNPWIAIRFITIFKVDERYYRFFWMLPITILVTYMFGKILERYNRICKISIFVICLLVFVFCRRSLLSPPVIPDNMYKISKEVIQAADIVTEDKNGIKKKALYDTTFFYEIRQYDASFQSFINEKELKELANIQLNEKHIIETIIAKDYHTLIKYIYFLDATVNDNLIKAAFHTEQVDYIFMSKSKTALQEQFIRCGCAIIGETENYIILRWN